MTTASGSDVFVTFGGDTAGLEGAAAAVRAKMAELAKDMRRTAVEFNAAGAAADSALGQKLRGLGTEMTALKGKSGELATALKPLVEGSGHGGRGAGFYTFELRALWDELSSGRAHQAMGTFSRLMFAFADSAPVMAGATAGLLAVAGAIGYFAYEAYEGNRVYKQFRDSLAASGKDVPDKEAKGLAASFRELTGFFGGDDAAKMAASLATMKNGSTAVFEAIKGDVKDFAAVTGQEVTKASETLKDVFANPGDAVKKLSAAFGDLTEAERLSLRAAEDSLDPAKAQAAIQEIIATRLNNVREARIREIDTQIEETKRWRDQMSNQGAGFSMGAPENRDVQALESERQSLVLLNEEALRTAKALSSAVNPTDTMIEKMRELVNATLPWAKGIEDAQNHLKQLQGGLGALKVGISGASGDPAEMIRHFEGFRSQSYQDSDGRWRVGYGSDTQNGQAVTQGTTTTKEAAEADLAQRIEQIQATLEREIGASWGRISASAKASLIDMAYNYGDLAKKKPGVIAAAQAGNESGVSDEMIRAMGDNSGANSIRRLAEARNIQNRAPEGAPDPGLVAQGAAAENQLKQNIQDATDAQAGGNAVAKAQADILDRNAAGQKDSVKDAREMVKAWESVLSTSHTQEKVISAQNGLHRAQVTLAEKLLDIEKSKNTLAAKDAATPAEKLKVGLASADLAYKSAGGDVAGQNAALAQKKAAQEAYDKAILAMAKETENSSYEAAKAALDKKQALVKADLAMHTIGNAQKAQADQTILAEREALESSHYAKLRDLETKGTLEYQTAQDKLTQITAQESTKRAQIEAADAEKIAAQYRSVFEGIGGNLSSSIMGMINRTETFRQAMAQLSGDILKMFIDMGMKMLMDWTARQAQMVVMTAIGETQQTAAVAAGTSAREGLAAAGSEASIATLAVNAFKAITMDAKQVGAGVAAFLAPILGPAAVPAGAAAGASVMAASLMDIGAYQIDQDQLAFVHRNELVMPAAQAGAFRSMLDNAASGRGAAGGAGASGGDTHVHLNVSALDAGSVKSWFGNNSRQIMQAMHQATRNGDHQGLRRLGTT